MNEFTYWAPSLSWGLKTCTFYSPTACQLGFIKRFDKSQEKKVDQLALSSPTACQLGKPIWPPGPSTPLQPFPTFRLFNFYTSRFVFTLLCTWAILTFDFVVTFTPSSFIVSSFLQPSQWVLYWILTNKVFQYISECKILERYSIKIFFSETLFHFMFITTYHLGYIQRKYVEKELELRKRNTSCQEEFPLGNEFALSKDVAHCHHWGVHFHFSNPKRGRKSENLKLVK